MTTRGRSCRFPESTPPSQDLSPFSWFGEVSLDPRIYPCLPEYTPFSTFFYVWPSQNLPLLPRIYPLFNNYVRPSHDLPLLSRIYPLFNNYATLSESTPPSQNTPLFQQIYATLPESTPPSLNIPPFSTTICDPCRIYRPSQNIPTPVLVTMCDPPKNLPLPLRIYPPFQHLCATLPGSTRPSQNIPPFLTTICDPPRIYPSLPEYNPLFNSYMQHTQNLTLHPKIYPLF